MPLIAFLLPTLFWPQFAEAANTPKWMLLSVLVPFLCPKMPGWAVLWLLFGAASTFWATSHYDAILALWQFGLLIGLILAAKQADFDKCMTAYCWGIALNTVIVGLQLADIHIVPKSTGTPGLLMNPNYLAAAALLGCIYAATKKQWALLVFMLPCLVVPMAKGPLIVAAALFLLVGFKRFPVTATALFCGAVGLIVYFLADFSPDQTVMARWQMWQNAAAMWQPWGQGIGSFQSTYPAFWNAVTETGPSGYAMLSHPRSAHNDLITLSVELGLVGILTWFGLLALCFTKGESSYVLIAFLGIGMFSHPILVPSTAAIAAIAAGNCLQRWDVLRATHRLRRVSVRSSPSEPRPCGIRALFTGGWSDAFKQTFPVWRGIRVHSGEHGPSNGGARD
jgi:hypothetical protein